MSSQSRSHYIRTVILDSLRVCQPYGIAMDLLVHGAVTSPGTVFITREEVDAELDWLGQKALLLLEGAGEERRVRLSAKGVTFVNERKPWAKLEVLD